MKPFCLSSFRDIPHEVKHYHLELEVNSFDKAALLAETISLANKKFQSYTMPTPLLFSDQGSKFKDDGKTV